MWRYFLEYILMWCRQRFGTRVPAVRWKWVTCLRWQMQFKIKTVPKKSPWCHLHHRPPFGWNALSKIAAACNLPLIAALRETCVLLHYIIWFVPAYFSCLYPPALGRWIQFVLKLWGDEMFFVVSLNWDYKSWFNGIVMVCAASFSGRIW